MSRLLFIALFATLALAAPAQAADPAAYFALPRDRTVLMGTDVEI